MKKKYVIMGIAVSAWSLFKSHTLYTNINSVLFYLPQISTYVQRNGRICNIPNISCHITLGSLEKIVFRFHSWIQIKTIVVRNSIVYDGLSQTFLKQVVLEEVTCMLANVKSLINLFFKNLLSTYINGRSFYRPFKQLFT